MREFDVIVVGGGINGLSTAWWLLRRGVRRVAVVEQFALGHDRGSSHGRSRITRSAYAEADYVRLMQVAHAEAWPALEADAGERLLHRRDGCFFGHREGRFREYLDAVAGIDVDVELLDPAEARRRFPAFRFDGDHGILHDRTAAVVAAADTMAALTRLVRSRATIIQGCTVRAIDPVAVTVDTTEGILRAGHLVVTAGAWASRLLPTLPRPLVPLRQTVVYVDAELDTASLPVWAWRGEGDFFYGLPAFQRPGLKAANHVVEGPGDDPDGDPGEPDVAAVLAFLEEHLAVRPGPILAVERCLYTVAPNEDFVFDHHPENAAVVVGVGMSGHGFKFGPLTGRILAELVLDGKTTVAPFEAARARFGWGG